MRMFLWPILWQSGGFTSDVCLAACAFVLIGSRLLDCILSERFHLQGKNNMHALSREQKNNDLLKHLSLPLFLSLKVSITMPLS